MEPTCEEMQSEELEALAAILGDDFVLLPGTWKNQPAQFQMKVLPPTGQVEETYASVYIIMRYTKNYPKTAPVVEVQKKAGLSAEELKSLEKLLQTKARELVGEVMAWELIDTAKEYLAKHNNKPPVSFYEEMVMNRQKGQQESWQQSKEDNQSLASEATRRKELMTSNAAGRSDAHHADDLFGNKQRISPRGSSTEDWLMPFWDDPITADPYLSDFYGDGADTSASNDVREDEGEGLDKGEEHGAKRRLSKNKTMDAHHSHYPLNNNLLQGKGRGVDAHNLAGWLQQPAIQWKRRNTLGKGTFGEVILGMNLTTHKLMAVKEIDFGGVANPSQTMEFVEQEIDSLRDLHHQHIVSYLGTERESNTLRIFLEFVAGASTIDALLRENGGFEETMLRKYTRQILEGLKYLHDRAIVHGDIKCPNMLLDHKGNIKLSDYGCSNQKIKSLLSGKGQTKDHPSDLMSGKQEDIYDLGLAVLQMADGVSRNRDKLPVLPSTLPTHAKDFLVSCFKKNPKDRPPVSKLLEHPFVADISTHNPWYLPGSPPSSIAPFMPRMKPLSESEPSSLTTSTESLSMQPPSRYRSDFEELEEIGRGGFGSVVKARNKLDGRLYAIKKIKLDPDDHSLNQKILREVTTLSRLNHQYVVRYYQAWTEGGVPGEQYGYSSSEEDEGMTEEDEEEDWFGSATSIPPSFMTDKPVEELECNLENEDPFETDSEDDDDDDGEERAWIKDDFASDSHDDSATATDDAEGSRDFEPVAPKEQISNKQKTRLPETLYIQMEYCSRNTLRQEIDKGLTEEEVWRLFRQILEGLNHIHLQGIIHRDLKPSNVFLDANSNIKIGDFGLATTGAGRVAKKDLRSASNESNSFSDIGSSASKESHTIGVGTPFYCSPEQLKEGMHYDQKVDTYSLGIILFEMCYPLATAMERVKTLTALRENMDFPPDFKSNHPVESELITWLLQEDPSARPTTMELLKSDLLPPKLEEEILKEALRTITIPGTTIFSLLMEKLFSFEPDEHLDYTYDAHTGKAHSTTELLVREKVFNEVTAIFKRHGAVLVETSLLMPKSPLLEQATNVAGLLDDAGTPIMLPYNLTLPFARYAAHREPITLKRYNIDRVYRKNPAGGHPRELYECDFDIIGPTACTLVHDAEVIRVIGEVLDVFSHSLGPFIIRLNHHKIFEAVLEVCEFPTNTYAKVCSAIEQLWRKKGPRNQANVAAGTTSISFSKGKEQKSWAGIAKSLLRLEGVTQKAVEALAQFVNMRGDMETTLRKLGRLLRRQKRGMEGVNDLKVLTRYLQSFNMLSKVVLDVGLVHNWAFYDGIIFHAVLQNSNSDVIAAGGRYDELVAKFRSPHSTKPSMAAVGVNIAIAKIINTVIMHEQRKSKKEGYRLRNCETEVFVCSVGRNMVEERISIATELWSRDIKAEYMHPPKKSLGEMYIFCKQAGIPWMVNLKDRSYDSEERLKVKNVMSNVETELHRSELADFLVAQLRGKRSALSSVALPTTTTTKPSELPPQISSHQPAAPATKQQHKGSLDVVFLNDTISAKKKTRIRTEANRAICKNRYLLNSLNLESVKVLALELPFHVIKEIVAGGSGASSLDGSGEQAADKLSTHYNMHPLIQKYPRYSSNIRQLRDFIVDKGRNFPILFLFSVLDEKFELMLVQ